MSRRIFDFGHPDRFLAGTVGRPGDRTFFLQARRGSALVSVVLEKIQVQVLAERMTLLLAEVARRGVRVPEALGPGDDDTAPLDEPLVEAFRVGTMTLAWNGESDEIVVEARARPEVDDDEDDEDDDAEDEDDDEEEAIELSDDDPDGPDLLRVRLTPTRARAFAEGALRTVAAGRPPCPLCGLPLDPTGHLCPRRNGYVH
ncbi:MAG TPA: DUF3090 family protein [Patescibacteria group bacterium]|nr:DUF3090 family protein [Patescibacteria group bacterium]